MDNFRSVGPGEPVDLTVLASIADRVRWLSAAIVDAANRNAPAKDGIKVGGHQASSSSVVEIMTSLWFQELTALDRISVKPHASPVLYAVHYLLGHLSVDSVEGFRSHGGLPAYPNRLKTPGLVDFTTGSMGLGATATLWAALACRFIAVGERKRQAGRFFAVVGDAELDEGAIWEAVFDPMVACLGEIIWIVDVNSQSLDRVLPKSHASKAQAMFEAAGWQVLSLRWGRKVSQIFEAPGGAELRQRLESMSSSEFQRLLRSPLDDVKQRLLVGQDSNSLKMLLDSMESFEVLEAVSDLGGHDIALLLESYLNADPLRPTVIFAHTVKGRHLPTEAHAGNHSMLLNDGQMRDLAFRLGADWSEPWRLPPEESAEGILCSHRKTTLERESFSCLPSAVSPKDFGLTYKSTISTQTAFGRFLTEFSRQAPGLAQSVVTCSADVALSTNLGGWVNRSHVWSLPGAADWSSSDEGGVLRWREDSVGQHIELGIAEVNLVSLLGELGSTWSRWGKRLIPIGTLYDAFLPRALEPWSFGMYAGGQSILVGTPSGVTLAHEGGAHQSASTPSIGLQQPGCISWEPAFAQDLEWALLAAIDGVGATDGSSAYFRLSTRPVDQRLADVPSEASQRAFRREQVLRGGYRLVAHSPGVEDVVLVGVGAVMPNVLEAAELLTAEGIHAGVICLTSPDLVFRAFHSSKSSPARRWLEDLFAQPEPSPIVSVVDGHPHTLAFLSGVFGSSSVCLGVTEFGQSSSLGDAYALHGLDANAIVEAARRLAAER